MNKVGCSSADWAGEVKGVGTDRAAPCNATTLSTPAPLACYGSRRSGVVSPVRFCKSVRKAAAARNAFAEYSSMILLKIGWNGKSQACELSPKSKVAEILEARGPAGSLQCIRA